MRSHDLSPLLAIHWERVQVRAANLKQTRGLMNRDTTRRGEEGWGEEKETRSTGVIK